MSTPQPSPAAVELFASIVRNLAASKRTLVAVKTIRSSGYLTHLKLVPAEAKHYQYRYGRAVCGFSSRSGWKVIGGTDSPTPPQEALKHLPCEKCASAYSIAGGEL